MGDPEFPRGRANAREGDANLLFCKIFAKNKIETRLQEIKEKARKDGRNNIINFRIKKSNYKSKGQNN